MIRVVLLFCCLSTLPAHQNRHHSGARREPHHHSTRTHFNLSSLDIGSCDWDTWVESDYGRKDVKNVSAPASHGGPGLCCGHCDRTHQCTHWTWAGGHCWLKTNYSFANPPKPTPCVRVKSHSTRDVWPSSWMSTCASGLASSLSSSSQSSQRAAAAAAPHADTTPSTNRGFKVMTAPTKMTPQRTNVGGNQRPSLGNMDMDSPPTRPPPRLFCFMVVRPTKSEHALMRLQLQVLRKCDAFAIYSNSSDFSAPFGNVLTNDGDDLPLLSASLSLPDTIKNQNKKQQQQQQQGGGGIQVPPGLKGRSMDVPYGPFKNALNTPIFLPVFKHAFGFVAAVNAAAAANAATNTAVNANANDNATNNTNATTNSTNHAAPSSSFSFPPPSFSSFDWAVKLDVDTVLAVDRLRTVLSQHDPSQAQVLCNKPVWQNPLGLHHPTCLDGPLEVVSAAAAELYASKAKEACEAKIIDSSSMLHGVTHSTATEKKGKNSFAARAQEKLLSSSDTSSSSSSSLTFDVGKMGEDWYLDVCFAEALIPSWVPPSSAETTGVDGSRDGSTAGHRVEKKHKENFLSSRLPSVAVATAAATAGSTTKTALAPLAAAAVAAAAAATTTTASLPRAPSVIEPRLLVNSYPLWPLQGNVTDARQLEEWRIKNAELQQRQASRNLEWCRGPHKRGSKAALHPVKDPGEFARCLALVLLGSS